MRISLLYIYPYTLESTLQTEHQHVNAPKERIKSRQFGPRVGCVMWYVTLYVTVNSSQNGLSSNWTYSYLYCDLFSSFALSALCVYYV